MSKSNYVETGKLVRLYLLFNYKTAVFDLALLKCVHSLNILQKSSHIS